jgi:hypothetical protein
MKYLISSIIILSLISCSDIDTIKVDFNIKEIETSYRAITLDSEISEKELIINSNEKTKVLYFFNPKCPGCWFQYEDLCDKMIKYSSSIDLYVFIHDVDMEFIRDEKFKIFKIKKEIYIIDKKPVEFEDEVLYYLSKSKKQVYSVLNQQITDKEINHMMTKF